LLFAVPKSQAVPLLDAWKSRFPALRLTCVGRVTAESGLRLRDRGGVRTLDLHGYAHFAQS
jgi:thiamine monophosphate kinase